MSGARERYVKARNKGEPKEREIHAKEQRGQGLIRTENLSTTLFWSFQFSKTHPAKTSPTLQNLMAFPNNKMLVTADTKGQGTDGRDMYLSNSS